MVVRIICESTGLAVECLQAGQVLGLAVETDVRADWLPAAVATLGSAACAVALESALSLEQAVELGHAARSAKHPVFVASLAGGRQAEWLRRAALDLGVTALPEIEPLLSGLSLLSAGAARPWTASVRSLEGADKLRLEPALASGARHGGHISSGDRGLLTWAQDLASPACVVGKARDLAIALSALRDTDRDTPQVESSVDVDPRAVLDVLFGPKRSLSDPASKAALLPYGIPVPIAELCASASRAAAEANRIGYPVRISLASPDLRVWDHPDLAFDMVDNAARVRDTFRQLMGLAKSRLEQAAATDPRAIDRLLGVMVTATSEASALLGVRAWPLPRGRVGMELGFADPHGAAASDRTLAVLPAPLPAIERILRRLAGSELLFGGGPAQSKAHLDAIGDVLLRLSAFTHDRRDHVSSVELRPLALLLDGSVEVREACVSVSDAFERSLGGNPEARAQ
jgi:hypothetical protein